MRRITHLRPSDARRVPWKNGGGATDELAIAPAGANFERGDFDWRISRAAVTQPGPFSTFAGFERVLVVLEGATLELAHGDLAARVRLRRLEPYRFSGDWPTKAELPAGPITDFNVLTRRACCRAEGQALVLGTRRLREPAEAREVFLYVARGSVAVRITGEDARFELGRAESLWIHAPRELDELDVLGTDGSAEVVLVRIRASEVR